MNAAKVEALKKVLLAVDGVDGADAAKTGNMLQVEVALELSNVVEVDTAKESILVLEDVDVLEVGSVAEVETERTSRLS